MIPFVLLLASTPAPGEAQPVLATLAAPGLVLAAPAGKGAAGTALLREAKGLRYAQRWMEAAGVYRRFLAENPGSGKAAEARFWLAATLEADQRWDEAAEAYGAFLQFHGEERLLGREAKLNRIRCWGIRQGQAPGATPGLLGSLGDPIPEVRVAAALQLAKTGDPRSVETLKLGLSIPSSSQACSMALIAMGVKPASAQASVKSRFLVIRVREAGKQDTVTIRLSLTLAMALSNYLSDEQLRQAEAKGIDLNSLRVQAAQMAPGTLLFSVDDGKSSVAVTVE